MKVLTKTIIVCLLAGCLAFIGWQLTELWGTFKAARQRQWEQRRDNLSERLEQC